MKGKIGVSSILIFICLLGLQYWFSLKEETELPSDNWSRSFPINSSQSNYSKLRSVDNEEGYAISLQDFKKLDMLSCDKDLNCAETDTYNHLDTKKNSWSDGINTFYIQEDKLIQLTQGSEKVIAQTVVNFYKSNDELIYWDSNHQLTKLNIQREGEFNQYQFNEPIIYINIIGDHTFVVTTNQTGEKYQVYNISSELTEIFNFDVKYIENLLSINIVQLNQEEFSLLKELEIVSGGSRGKAIHMASFILAPDQTPSFNKLSFIENDTKAKLKDISYLSVYQGEREPLFAFSADLMEPNGEYTYKIFAGRFERDSIYAEALTKKGNHYSRPLIINDETIAYLSLDGNNRSLVYSSSIDEKKIESSKIIDGDYKAALYTFLTKLFNGILLILICLFWIIPALAITFCSKIIMNKLNYRHYIRTSWIISIVSLFIIQLVFFFNFYQYETLIFNSSFLSNNVHFIILLLISLMVSTLPLLFSKLKITEDSFSFSVIFTALMNAAILFFLIGPYMI